MSYVSRWLSYRERNEEKDYYYYFFLEEVKRD